jgi:hypothetical protein
MRNSVCADEVKSAWSSTHHVECAHHCLCNKVTVITRHTIGTFTVNIDPNPRFVRYLRNNVVVEGDGQAECIEARA